MHFFLLKKKAYLYHYYYSIPYPKAQHEFHSQFVEYSTEYSNFCEAITTKTLNTNYVTVFYIHKRNQSN